VSGAPGLSPRSIALIDRSVRGDRAGVRALLDHRRVTPAVLADTCAELAGLLGAMGASVRPVTVCQPCGTHAAYVRHRAHGEPPDLACAEAERAYQRNRKRRFRALQKGDTA
jgi:hypothetical protein